MNGMITVAKNSNNIDFIKYSYSLGVRDFRLNMDYEQQALEAIDKIHALARHYAVIFVTEKVYQDAESIIKRYQTRPYPVIVPIPSAEGNAGTGMKGIKANVEKAIGADILFDKEDK